MFDLQTNFSPAGDQRQAFESLSQGVVQKKRSQVLLGVTGSGKTYTMAQIIQRVKKPTLVLAHNKTLAAQLFEEFRLFFPKNAVEYFVSYYDYYQPEAYLARTDTYIEKDMSINDQIDRMRLSATRSLLSRKDVIIVASVSCIYGLGMPEYYAQMNLSFCLGQEMRFDDLLIHLVEMHYKRNDFDFSRGTFRVKGDVLEVFPAYEEDIALRVLFFADEIEKISLIDPLTQKVIKNVETFTLFPGSHHVTPEDVRSQAIESIKKELKEQKAFFSSQDKLLEQQRIYQRTCYDLEMIKEIGFCKGIENYSRHFSQRNEGEPPACLIDYFSKDFLCLVDESHQTIPQLHAMCHGDRSRKRSLVDYGFRLPSAYDNRPLRFEEFYQKLHSVIYVSATPGEWEVQDAQGVVVQQVLRPTGLLDPLIEVRPASCQIDDSLDEIRRVVAQGERVLVTALTKKLAEKLAVFLSDLSIKAKYLHSDISTLDRIEIIKSLRQGEFEVLVGVNLLREGLDIPEVSLVVILDADKEGFLRSETALIQTCGRAARNEKGRVIMYADKETKAIQKTCLITRNRRDYQHRYNQKHGIIPKSTQREIAKKEDSYYQTKNIEQKKLEKAQSKKNKKVSLKEIQKKIREFEKAMKLAAKELDFEQAAYFRDQMKVYQDMELSFI